MFCDPFLFHNKIHLVAASCLAVTAKVCLGTGLWVDLEAGGFIRVEGTAQAVVSVGFQVVVAEHF